MLRGCRAALGAAPRTLASQYVARSRSFCASAPSRGLIDAVSLQKLTFCVLSPSEPPPAYTSGEGFPPTHVPSPSPMAVLLSQDKPWYVLGVTIAEHFGDLKGSLSLHEKQVVSLMPKKR